MTTTNTAIFSSIEDPDILQECGFGVSYEVAMITGDLGYKQMSSFANLLTLPTADVSSKFNNKCILSNCLACPLVIGYKPEL